MVSSSENHERSPNYKENHGELDFVKYNTLFKRNNMVYENTVHRKMAMTKLIQNIQAHICVLVLIYPEYI